MNYKKTVKISENGKNQRGSVVYGGGLELVSSFV